MYLILIVVVITLCLENPYKNMAKCSYVFIVNSKKKFLVLHFDFTIAVSLMINCFNKILFLGKPPQVSTIHLCIKMSTADSQQ